MTTKRIEVNDQIVFVDVDEDRGPLCSRYVGHCAQNLRACPCPHAPWKCGTCGAPAQQGNACWYCKGPRS